MKKKIIVISSILLLIPCLVVGASFFLKSADVAKVDKKPSKQETPRQQAPKQASEHKIAYLTIDDGPTKHMSAIVAALKKENVKATFFLVGNNITGNRKQAVKEAAQAGHSIGMHSMTHDAKKLYNNGQFIPEMEQESTLLNSLLGKQIKLIRAPYGSTYLNNAQIQNAKKKKYRLLDWNIDSEDWRHKGKPQEIVASVKEQLDKFHKVSPVILVHETEDTLNAIPSLIKAIREKGFELMPYFEDNDFHLNFRKDPDL
ncbi:polysaccharide deacetylase family protein [Listeria newyorkensis]|uniref:Polysaccharide deacetylase n=1 Tax=Listeria newyorkensis TaxID=1497681 RepID=A0A841YXM9_9LIST|nr:polysaccharide deacetylase family protein [Listeria newyorkensis]MBC1457692.1 polysaccharide deacetylase [Listeria newyorkensis]